MALGRRNLTQQHPFVSAVDLAAIKLHPYYDALNKLLDAHHFDRFVEQLCASFYAGNVGRPGLAPGVWLTRFRSKVFSALRSMNPRRITRRSRARGD